LISSYSLLSVSFFNGKNIVSVKLDLVLFGLIKLLLLLPESILEIQLTRQKKLKFVRYFLNKSKSTTNLTMIFGTGLIHQLLNFQNPHFNPKSNTFHSEHIDLKHIIKKYIYLYI
jgi:hypothetical protein